MSDFSDLAWALQAKGDVVRRIATAVPSWLHLIARACVMACSAEW